MPNSTPSCRPAVPPPPVWGAVVGKAVFTGADAVAGGVDGRIVVTDGLTEAEADADAGVDTGVEADTDADAGACGEPDAGAPARRVTDAVGAELPDDRDAWPAGKEVRALDCGPVCGPVCGLGLEVSVDPPPVQAETATATRTAPAAERPTVSHAPRALPGTVRDIFMSHPRMPVR